MIPAFLGNSFAAAGEVFARSPTVSFLLEALAIEPISGRFSPILKKEQSRLKTFGSLGVALFNWMDKTFPIPIGMPAAGPFDQALIGTYLSESLNSQSSGKSAGRNPMEVHTDLPDDPPSTELDTRYHGYLQEPDRLKAELYDLVAQGNGLELEESLAPKAFDEQGNALPFGLLGILATPPNAFMTEFARLQKRYKDLLANVVKEEVSEEDFAAEYKDLLKNLNFLDPDFIHFILAEIKADSAFKVHGREFKVLWEALTVQTEEISRFRQAMDFDFHGQLLLLPKKTATIAAFLMPKTREDLSRFLGLKMNYGYRLPARTELAHVSLAYVRGLKESRSGRYRVSAKHLRWLATALDRMEEKREDPQCKTEPLTWPVKGLEVVASENVNKPVQKTSFRLVASSTYRRLIEQGKQKLADVWNDISGPQDLDGDNPFSRYVLTRLDAVLGLFPRQHLRNLRALFAALGSGEITTDEILELIRHEQRVRCVPRYVRGIPTLHITARYDRPGNLEAIFRVLDRSGGIVINISQTHKLNPEDPPDAQLAIDVQIDSKTIKQDELITLAGWISGLPDIGHTPRTIQSLQNVLRHWFGQETDLITIKLHVSLPRKEREPGVTSQRTRILGALKNLPHSSLSQLELTRPPENSLQDSSKGPEIQMTVKVPRSVAEKVPGQLLLAIGPKGSVRDITNDPSALQIPLRVHEKAVKALAAQERILKNARLAMARHVSRLPAGTILRSDLDATQKREHEEFIHLIAVDPPKTLNINLEDVPVSASMELMRWDVYIEKPAQNLVRKILELEGQITRVNAFDSGWKGIFWTLEEEEYFTPLSLKDYDGPESIT